MFGFLSADTAALHIKQLFLVKFAAGGAVRTLDVVRKNFQFGFGVDFRRIAQQQRFMQLAAFGFYRMRRNADFSLKKA